MTIPSGLSPTGLPIGTHFGAAFGNEQTLFALARQLEIARPWANARGALPPLRGHSNGLK